MNLHALITILHSYYPKLSRNDVANAIALQQEILESEFDVWINPCIIAEQEICKAMEWRMNHNVQS